MCRGICFLLLLLTLPGPNALALAIRIEGSSSSAPFELTYQDLQSPLVIVLQVANESEATVSILSWQLVELELRPLSGAQGNLLFHSAAAPPDSLFGQVPGPESDLTMPSTTVSAFDTDPNFVGEPISPHSARNILQLTLGAPPETAGAFQLLMPEVDDPEADSSWFDADGFSAKAFDNSAPSAFQGFVLLGTINVSEAPSFAPGDYNSDGNVDAADYDRWRAEFGITVSSAGADADGNRNGIVDAADYVVWRDNVDPQGDAARNIVGATLPEPGGIASAIAGLAGVAGLLRPPQKKNCLAVRAHSRKARAASKLAILGEVGKSRECLDILSDRWIIEIRSWLRASVPQFLSCEKVIACRKRPNLTN